jgi:hypothetical protein
MTGHCGVSLAEVVVVFSSSAASSHTWLFWPRIYVKKKKSMSWAGIFCQYHCNAPGEMRVKRAARASVLLLPPFQRERRFPSQAVSRQVRGSVVGKSLVDKS